MQYIELTLYTEYTELTHCNLCTDMYVFLQRHQTREKSYYMQQKSLYYPTVHCNDENVEVQFLTIYVGKQDQNYFDSMLTAARGHQDLLKCAQGVKRASCVVSHERIEPKLFVQ